MKVNVQKALTEKLDAAAKEYAVSYYTNRYITAHCELVELECKLKNLKDKS